MPPHSTWRRFFFPRASDIERGNGGRNRTAVLWQDFRGPQTDLPCCPSLFVTAKPNAKAPANTQVEPARAQDNDEGRGAAPRDASDHSSQLQRRTYAAPSRVRWPRPACRRTAHPSSVEWTVDTTRHQPSRSQTRVAKRRPYLVAGHQAQPNLGSVCSAAKHLAFHPASKKFVGGKNHQKST